MERDRALATTCLLSVVLAVVLACDGLEGRNRRPARLPPIPAGLQADEHNTIEVFRRTSRSVVFVRNSEIRRRSFITLNATEITRGTGSGFVWDRLGHIVTNFHVIEGGNRFAVTLSDGSIHEAELVGSAPRKDIAVLRIETDETDLVPLEIGDSSALVVGQ